MSFSRYDEDGARTSHHTHCCIGARRAAHCATGDDDNNSDCDNIITFVRFLIHKQWLILSLENKSRGNVTTLEYFKDELSTHLRIYDLCKKFSVKEIFNIEALVEGL